MVDRLADDLATAEGGARALAELHAQGAVFAGEVLGLAVEQHSRTRSTVSVTVRRSVLAEGRVIRPARIDLWLFMLVVDPADGHWQVAGIERS